jgi:hypothetical protein
MSVPGAGGAGTGDGVPLFIELNSWRSCDASVEDSKGRDASVPPLLLLSFSTVPLSISQLAW